MPNLPAQMTVVAISKPGGPEMLVPETRALPAPKAGEVLVKVAAAGINRPDVAQRSGSYPPPPGASDLPASRSRAKWSHSAKAQSTRSATR